MATYLRKMAFTAGMCKLHSMHAQELARIVIMITVIPIYFSIRQRWERHQFWTTNEKMAQKLREELVCGGDL